jgi:phosphatidylinositol-3-phosphatase
MVALGVYGLPQVTYDETRAHFPENVPMGLRRPVFVPGSTAVPAAGVASGAKALLTPAGPPVDNPRVSRPSITRLGTALAALLGFGVAVFGGPAASALGPSTPHLVIIVMENKEYSSVVGSSAAPYINGTLIPASRVFTKYYAEEHPSLPNYLALSSAGSAGCVADNCPVGFDPQENLFHQMDTAAVSWKAYQESMPSNCFGANQGAYLVRHNPPPYYSNLTTCATKDVRFTEFATDLQNGTLPDFSWITPNKYNDMHSDQKRAPCLLANTTLNKVCQGDRWLSQNLPPLLALNNDGVTSNDVTVIVTFDEGSTGEGGGGRVLTLVTGPNVTPGTQNSTMFGHLGLLNAMEDWFGLPQLHPTLPPL